MFCISIQFEQTISLIELHSLTFDPCQRFNHFLKEKPK